MSEADDKSAAELIDAMIAAIPDWRGPALGRLRALIREADPQVVETVKWRKPTNPDGVPVWEHGGVICTGAAFKGYVKLTFAKGALIADPKGVFNNGLTGNSMRAIDLREGEMVDAGAFKTLFRAAVALNAETQAKRAGKKNASD
jgi:hypothetical protein